MAIRAASASPAAGELVEPVTAGGSTRDGRAPAEPLRPGGMRPGSCNIASASPATGGGDTSPQAIAHGGLVRRSPLRRRTPLQPGRAPQGSARARSKAKRPERDWTAARAKVTAERVCRVCGRGPHQANIEAAHIIGRRYDRPAVPGGPLLVDPDHVVPLCRVLNGPGAPGCHVDYDEHRLDLLPHLTAVELAAAVALVGEGPALRRITNRRTA